jgi:hypothetical protein
VGLTAGQQILWGILPFPKRTTHEQVTAWPIMNEKMKMAHIGWLENSDKFHRRRLWFVNGFCGIFTPFLKKSIVDVRVDR